MNADGVFGGRLILFGWYANLVGFGKKFNIKRFIGAEYLVKIGDWGEGEMKWGLPSGIVFADNLPQLADRQ